MGPRLSPTPLPGGLDLLALRGPWALLGSPAQRGHARPASPLGAGSARPAWALGTPGEPRAEGSYAVGNFGCESLDVNALGPIPLHQTVVLADNHGCDSFGFGMAGSKPIGPESLHRGATQECAEEQLAMI